MTKRWPAAIVRRFETAPRGLGFKFDRRAIGRLAIGAPALVLLLVGFVFGGARVALAATPPLVSSQIVSATEAGTTVTVTTATPHGLLASTGVYVSGVGLGGYNGAWTITSVTSVAPYTFTYTDSVSGLAPSGGGTAANGMPAPAALHLTPPWAAGVPHSITTLAQPYGSAGDHDNFPNDGQDYYAIDFGLSYEDVHPVSPGSILFWGWGGKYLGCIVVVGHDVPGFAQFQSVYAHLGNPSVIGSSKDCTSAVKVKSGPVDPSMAIATSGETGNAYGPHLHFALYEGSTLEYVTSEGGERPVGGVAVIPEPLVGQQAYENFEWFKGPITAADPVAYSQADTHPGGTWTGGTGGTPSYGDTISPGTSVVYKAHVTSSHRITEVNLTAGYVDWADASKAPWNSPAFPSGSASNPGLAIWRIVGTCAPGQSCWSNGAANGTSGDVTLTWNVWSDPLGAAVSWLPPANAATPTGGKDRKICISFDVYDASGARNLAPNGVTCDSSTLFTLSASRAALASPADTTTDGARLIYLRALDPALDCDTSWAAAVDGSWADGTKWDHGVPDGTKRACITVTGSYTVTIGASASAASITLGLPGQQNPTLALANPCSGGLTVTAASGFTNDGTITLGGGCYNPTLSVSSGVLLNHGTIRTTGMTPEISASITNQGTLDFQSSATLSKASAVYASSGAVTVATSKTVTVGGGGPWTQTDGLVAVNGTLNLNGMAYTIGGGTLSNAGAVNLSGGSFTQSGGTVTGNPVQLGSSAALVLGPGVQGGAGFTFVGSGTIKGDIPGGDVITLANPCSGGLTVTAASGFTNDGTITLGGGCYNPTLSVSSGVLLNHGTIRTTGMTPEISASITNQGTLDFQSSATLSKASAVYASSGAVTVATSKTVTVGGGGPWTQTDGLVAVNGTLNLNGMAYTIGGGTLSNAGAVNLSGGSFTQSGGTVTGNPVQLGSSAALVLGPGVQGGAGFTFVGSGTIKGDIPGGDVITLANPCSGGLTVTAASGFTNDGTITLGGGCYNPTLSVSSGVLLNHGTIRTTGMTPEISASITNQGTLDFQSSATLSKASAVYASSGAVTVATSKTVTVGGGGPWTQTDGLVAVNGTLNLNGMAYTIGGGTLSNAGAVNLSGGSFTQSGGTVTGNPVQLGSSAALVLGPGVQGGAGFTFVGSGTIKGDIPGGDVITLANPCSGGLTVTAASGFTNDGTITLGGGCYNPTLSVSSGVLLNHGTIRTTGMTPEISASITNQGTLDFQSSATLSKASAVYASSGAVTVATSKTVTVGGGGPWTQTDGLVAVNGTLNLNGMAYTIGGGTLSNAGAVNLSGGSFTQSGGTVTGNPVQLYGASLGFPTGSGSGSYDMWDSASIAGDVPAEVVVTLQGSHNCYCNPTVTATAGLTNHGSIVIPTGYYTSQLAVPSGTLANVGTLQTTGSGTAHISGSLANQGEFAVGATTQVSRTAGTYTSGGTVTIEPSKALTFGGLFRQTAGSTVIGANATLAATGSYVEIDGGTLSGAGTVAPGLLNAGTVSPGGASVGLLTVQGWYQQTSAGTLAVDVTGASSNDQLQATGSLTLAGGVLVTTGFTPALGSSFPIIAGASRTGSFTPPQGAAPGLGLTWGYAPSSTGVSLLVIGPTAPGAPRNPTAIAGTQRATVSWLPPLSDGGSAITSYTVTSSPGAKTCTWTMGAHQCVVTGLSNGTTYTFTVQATNAIGPGPISPASNAVTPTPTIVACTPGTTSSTTTVASGDKVACSITAGTGAALTGWTAAGFTPTNSTSAALQFTAGTAGPGSVAAAFHDDLGDHQVAFQYTVVVPAPPGQPTNVAGIPGDGTISLSWTAPADTGTSPISGYAATATPDNTALSAASCAPSPATGTSCTIPGLTNGQAYTVTVVASSAAGDGPPSDPTPAIVPVVPPVPHMTTLSSYLLTTSATVRWSATAGANPVASYDVRVRHAAWSGTFGGYSTWKSATVSTSAAYGLARGYTYCFSVRARDATGALSGWSAETCTTKPLDDRSLSRSSGWTAGTSSSYYYNTYVSSTYSGKYLTRTSVVARQIAIVATTCSTCGSVRIYWRGKLIKTLSLHSSTTVNRKLITIATFSSVQSGTLKIVVYGSGKKVIVDGLAVRPL